MNKLDRNIVCQNGVRLVNGIPVDHDADVGIIFEKNSFLDIARIVLEIQNTDFYEGWDRDVLLHQLNSGALMAMTYAQSPSFAASAVERLIRTGVSHVLRIGTCGSLDSKINLWDLGIATGAIR